LRPAICVAPALLVLRDDCAMELRMDLPSIDFAPLQETKHAVRLAFSEAKAGFSPSLKALDAQGSGLVTRAAGIAKFNGAKKTGLDLIAPAGLDIGYRSAGGCVPGSPRPGLQAPMSSWKRRWPTRSLDATPRRWR
jgi:hypothetical protein